MSTFNDEGLSSNGLNNLKVNCYSGQSYAERPKSFLWEGAEYEVEEIEKERREPGERHFQVRTRDNKLFQLCYNEFQDQWSLTELIRS
jgi:hypothetical protein